jgi:hypothetical protein
MNQVRSMRGCRLQDQEMILGGDSQKLLDTHAAKLVWETDARLGGLRSRQHWEVSGSQCDDILKP